MTSLLIQTKPSGAEILINGRSAGNSPLSITGLESGKYFILAMTTSADSWGRQPADTTLMLESGISTRLILTLPATLQLTSIPSGGLLLENDRPLGFTPLLISRSPDGPIDLTLRTTGHMDYRWTWIPRPGKRHTMHIQPHPLTGWVPRDKSPPRLRTALYVGSAALAMAAGSILCSREADHAYDRYSATAHPDRIATHYRRAQRLDRWAGGLWAGFQVSIGGLLVWWLVT